MIITSQATTRFSIKFFCLVRGKTDNNVLPTVATQAFGQRLDHHWTDPHFTSANVQLTVHTSHCVALIEKLKMDISQAKQEAIVIDVWKVSVGLIDYLTNCQTCCSHSQDIYFTQNSRSRSYCIQLKSKHTSFMWILNHQDILFRSYFTSQSRTNCRKYYVISCPDQ